MSALLTAAEVNAALGAAGLLARWSRTARGEAIISDGLQAVTDFFSGVVLVRAFRDDRGRHIDDADVAALLSLGFRLTIDGRGYRSALVERAVMGLKP